MKKSAFYLDILYETIHVLELWEYLKLLDGGCLKKESVTKASTCYITVIKNQRVEWFARQMGTCGE